MQPRNVFSDTAKYELRLLGPLRLSDWHRRDITPSAKKTQGLLAMLAVANGAPITRATLQDRLWSDRMQAQGRDSLRQALRELRSIFVNDQRDVLGTTGDRVSLNPAYFRSDIGGQLSASELGPVPDFLEGCDIRDPEFEAWLRQTRVELSRGTVPEWGSAIPSVPEAPAPDTRLRISFRTSEIVAADPMASFAATILTERLSRHFLDQGVFRVLSGENTEEAVNARVQARAVRNGTEIAVFLSVHSELSGQVIANHEISVDVGALTGMFFQIKAARLCDQITQRIFQIEAREADDRYMATRHLLTGIDRLFLLSKPDLFGAENNFVKANAIEESGVSLAWLAYLEAFKFEKTFRDTHTQGREGFESIAAKALMLEPDNPLVAGLLAHVYAFVGRDYDRAFQLLEPFEDVTSDNLMLQDAMAMFRFYTGRLELAQKHANRAALLGRNNRHRYFFTASLAMIALAKGNTSDAIRHGEASLAQHFNPRGAYFEPVLRTLLAAYAHAGDRENTSRILKLIRAQDPGFTIAALERHEQAPIPNLKLFDIIRSGAIKAEREEQ